MKKIAVICLSIFCTSALNAQWNSGMSFNSSGSSGMGINNSSSGGCTSDYSCGPGRQCVKAQFSSSGRCMKVTTRYGVQKFNSNKSNSGVNMKRQCRYDYQCGAGWRCTSGGNCVR
ncbi:hypothetical protein ACM66Z_04935 [Sulfurovum sp. ST-21]|uniref:Uncharacterized protein n=1 Tax=Sulfurovum indicum TaxID=2779528 RepID=A0A7M1S903_9BACT|nr:hypothetical protein [Sulfurovum indicum]QOR62810.1 hypothetical protein IMZ28_04905 [Sulfurovum indicum]